MTHAVEATGGVGVGGAEPGSAQPPSRRDRLRAATTEEIIQTARRLLVASGPEAISLRAIAREMGMTAPGLYRYFGSHEELLRHVCASIFTELGEDIRRAIHRRRTAGRRRPVTATSRSRWSRRAGSSGAGR